MIEILNHSKPFDQIYPWFEIIQKKFDLESMPQALLLHGQAGIGKFDFAIHLAQSLLCEADLLSAGTKPCKQCEACRWFETGNHPDLIALVPQTYRKKLPHAALEGLEKSSEMLGDEEPESAKLEAESADIATEPKEKKQSGFIRMEQSLAAIQSMGIGSHRGGYRVLLIYPLELLRVEAANALLKSLEEPNPKTLFILVADRLDRVMPTIRSRCQLIAMPRPMREEALIWLQAQLEGQKNLKLGPHEIENALDEQGGAPLAARDFILAKRSDNDKDPLILATAATPILLEALSKGRDIPWLECAEKIHKAPYSSLLNTMQRWLSDIQTAAQAKQQRYYPRHAKQIDALAAQANLIQLMRLWKQLIEARRHENHPLSTRIQLESLLTQYQQIFEA